MISKKTIGLALSGGGTKGIAHIGVLQFLDEHNFTIKKIAGTSAGAIVGGLYACGKKPEEILNFFKSVNLFHWKHFTLTKPGIIDTVAFKPYFKEFIKDININKTKIPILITATNLISGQLKIFQNDENLIDAILASSSVPGVFSPYHIDGSLYTDGGVLNNFPTDLLQPDCKNIIGVYVSPLQEITKKETTSIRAVTSRAFDLFTLKELLLKSKLCAELVEPKSLTKYGTFENKKQKMDEIFEIGYQEAKKKLMPYV